MKTSIYEMISTRGSVNFGEMHHGIPGFRGDNRMTLMPDSNAVLWDGISEEAMTAIEELLQEGKIFIHGSSILNYHSYGVRPNLPSGSRIPKGGYKSPRWLPVCFCTYPPQQQTRKRH